MDFLPARVSLQPRQPRPGGGGFQAFRHGLRRYDEWIARGQVVSLQWRRRSPRGRIIGPQGLPLVKPHWGRITAIDLNSGEHVWMISNGEVPDAVKNHPAMKGIDLKNFGKPERSPLLVTKTLLFGADGPGLLNAGPGAGGKMFRAINKKKAAPSFTNSRCRPAPRAFR